jgi:cell division protein FtsZ
MPVEAAPVPHPAPETPPRLPAPSAHADYMKRPAAAQGYRPAQGTLDAQGRVAPARSLEDDQLEIPAFLRRQSS